MTAYQLIEGLKILCRYSSKEGYAPIEANHDIIMFDPSVTDSMISEMDSMNLEKFGWFVSQEYDCWCHFT